jgi:putative membrane protein
MRPRMHSELFVALALAGACACGGSEQQAAPPQTAEQANTTTTTSAIQPQSVQPMQAAPPTASDAPMTAPTNPSAPPTITPDTSATMASSGIATNTSASATQPASPLLDDAQITAILYAENNAQIGLAEAAAKESKNARVRELASHVLSDHWTALRDAAAIETKASIARRPTDDSNAVIASGTSAVATLRSAGHDDFDRTYLDAQSNEQHELLNAIDTRLLPQAHNVELKALLRRLRIKVTQHLEAMQSLRDSL